MKGPGEQNAVLAGVIAAGFALVASSVSAQDSGGLEANLTFSQGLSYSDTDGTFGRTDLGFGLTSETRTQNFDLSVSSGFEQNLDGGSLFEADEPSANLAYGIQSRQTALTTNLNYRQTDADEFVEDVNGIPGVLILDEGTREAVGADVGLAFGREAKFGGTVDLGYDRTAYSDSTSATLFDFERISAQFGLRFEIDPRITTTLDYSVSETNRANGRDVENQGLTLGGQFAVTPTLDANVSLGVTQITIDDGGVVSVEDGLSFGLSLEQDRPVGRLRFSLDSDLSESGRRTTARVGGTFETRRGNLNASFGLTESADSSIRPTLTLTYGEDLPRGSYSVSIDQAFDTDTDGDETLNSRLRLVWQQDLTQTSRVSSNLTYQMTDVLGVDDDTSRFQLGVSFSHDLTEDWALTTRYTHTIFNDDSAARTRENEVFIGLETSFGWRP